jgi:nucleotide-binding universal stress UspA family protein
MYRSVLVPLDRSSFAEQALPWAVSIARRANARLDLVEVHALYALDHPKAAWVPYDSARDAERQRQEQLYLDATAKWVTSVSPVPSTAAVLPGSALLPQTVADSVLERARAGQADLIVMATHGRSALSCYGLGSVADELVRRAPMPVLLVRPSAAAPHIIPEPVLENILIPLDGSALAERGVEPALDLAGLMEARVSLLRAVGSCPAAGDRGAGGPPEKGQAEVYLERVAGGLREQGLQVRTHVVAARHAAAAILAEAAAQGIDLIALATHGRGGLRRLLLGSVAHRLVRGAASPVLVYRPDGKEL